METYNPRLGIESDEVNGFTYEITDNPSDFNLFNTKQEIIPGNDLYYNIGEWRILPYGYNDNLPAVIKKTVEENSAAPGMLEKQAMLICGDGPFLYKEAITKEGNQSIIYRDWTEDSEIAAWLDSFDAEEYLNKCVVDYVYMKGAFSKLFRNKAQRVGGTDKIAKLQHMDMNGSRLACRIDSKDLVPTHIIETDFTFDHLDSITKLKAYPIFDKKDPFLYPTTAAYSSQYTFGNKNYTVPPIFGSLEWLKRSTATPIIFKALSQNSVNIKFHVESPQAFWDAEEDRLKENCKAKGETYEYRMLEEYRRNFMKDLLKVLTTDKNVGKLWHTRKIIEVQGNNIIEHGWKITPIDQKIKDYVEAQIKIKEAADRSLTAGISLHPGLSGVSEAGKVNGGSEQLYAFQNFKNSGVDIPERIICKVLNDAIAINWPNKKLKIGFHQPVTQSLSNINPSDRPIAQ